MRLFLLALVITPALATAQQPGPKPSGAPASEPAKKPNLIGLEQEGIHTSTHNSIMKGKAAKTPTDVRSAGQASPTSQPASAPPAPR